MRRWSWLLALCCLLAACGGATGTATGRLADTASPTGAPAGPGGASAPLMTPTPFVTPTPPAPTATRPATVLPPAPTLIQTVMPSPRPPTPTRPPATPPAATPVAGFPLTLAGVGTGFFAVTLPAGLLTLDCTYQGSDYLVVELGDPATGRVNTAPLLSGCPGTGSVAFAVENSVAVLVLVLGSGAYRLTFGTLSPEQLAAPPAVPQTFTGTGSQYFLVRLAAKPLKLKLDSKGILRVRLYTASGMGGGVILSSLGGNNYTATLALDWGGGVYILSIDADAPWSLAVDQ